jgi:hypothetical protein
VDQDIMPEWFDAAECEKRTRSALARRCKKGFSSVDVSGCNPSLKIIAGKKATVIR